MVSLITERDVDKEAKNHPHIYNVSVHNTISPYYYGAGSGNRTHYTIPAYGADYRNRTGDLLITSQLLYLLS